MLINICKRMRKIALLLFTQLYIAFVFGQRGGAFHMTIIGEDSVCITQKYMVLKPQGKKSAQGSACYGDYFVQGYNNNGYISFYNLEEKNICQLLKSLLQLQILGYMLIL